MANEHLAAEAVASKVLGLAAEIADQGKTVSAESVLRDLGFDDLSAIELVMSIEDDLEIDIDVSEYDNSPEAFLSLTLQALIDAALKAVAKSPAAALAYYKGMLSDGSVVLSSAVLFRNEPYK